MRVLVVDDDVRAAETIRRVLASDGWNVSVVHDGAEGFRSALEQRFDAVVLDIMLPGMNGFEIVRELRRRSDWVPIIMLSAKDGEYDLSLIHI